VRVRLARDEDFDAVAAITNHYIVTTAIHFATQTVTAASLHESMGFEPAGVIRGAGWKMGRWWDVAFWQKTLREGAAEERRPVSWAWAETRLRA